MEPDQIHRLMRNITQANGRGRAKKEWTEPWHHRGNSSRESATPRLLKTHTSARDKNPEEEKGDATKAIFFFIGGGIVFFIGGGIQGR